MICKTPSTVMRVIPSALLGAGIWGDDRDDVAAVSERWRAAEETESARAYGGGDVHCACIVPDEEGGLVEKGSHFIDGPAKRQRDPIDLGADLALDCQGQFGFCRSAHEHDSRPSRVQQSGRKTRKAAAPHCL